MAQPPALAPRPKRGYKGLESFFKRISYNLGNSPSQTEIKIISCIPIDVTDLQQRIVVLEKQLDDAYKGTQRANKTEDKKGGKDAKNAGKNNKKSVEARPVTVSTGFLQNLYNELPHDVGNVPVPISDPNSESIYGCGCSAGGSNPGRCNPGGRNPGGYGSVCGCGNKTGASEKTRKSCCSTINNSKKSIDSFLIYDQLTHEESKDIIKDDIIEMNNEIRATKKYKKKVNKRMKKLKEHFVYYAQTESSPFANNVPRTSPEPKCNLLSDDYVNDILKRQYNPKVILDGFSESSQFSSPVCRDTDHLPCTSNNLQPICKSSLSEFQNIDNHMPRSFLYDPLSVFNTNIQTGKSVNINRYDDNGYDKIPVREKSKKIEKNMIKNLDVNELEILCWPENLRPVRKIHPHVYHRYNSAGKARPVVKIPKKKKNSKRCVLRDQSTCMETTRSCQFECGKFYTKDLHPQQEKIIYARTPLNREPKRNLIDSSVMTELKNTECQTVTNTSVELETNCNCDHFKPDKKDQTLDQIKTILQTVLTEVKTNVQPISEKKDAIVQNDPLVNMEACSTLLNSFTYSYNNNPFISPDPTTYSQQLQSQANCFANAVYPQMRFVHPLLIQNAHRMPCTNSFKPTTYSQHKPHKAIIAAATNTQDCSEHKSETRKLIKEIYKSMALNLETHSKEDSNTDFSSPRITANVEQTSFKANLDSEYRQNIVSTLTVNNKRERREISIQENMSSSVQTSTSPEEDTSNTLTNTTGERTTLGQKSTVTNTARTLATDTKTSDINIGDTESESEESDHRVEVRANKSKKKESKGLFSRMKSIFWSKNKDKEQPQKQKEVKKYREEKKVKYTKEEVIEPSDSDDYETVYSQKIERKPRPRRVEKLRVIKPRAHSKVRRSRHSYHRHPERYAKTSHIESEHLRHWNDKVSFQGDRRHSSERRPGARIEQSRGYYGDIVKPRERPILRHMDDYNPNLTDSRWSSDRPSSRPTIERSGYNNWEEPPTKQTYIVNEEHMAPTYQPGIHFRHAKNRGNAPRVSKYVRATGYQPVVRKVIIPRTPEPVKKSVMPSWLNKKNKSNYGNTWRKTTKRF